MFLLKGEFWGGVVIGAIGAASFILLIDSRKDVRKLVIKAVEKAEDDVGNGYVGSMQESFIRLKDDLVNKEQS